MYLLQVCTSSGVFALVHVDRNGHWQDVINCVRRSVVKSLLVNAPTTRGVSQCPLRLTPCGRLKRIDHSPLVRRKMRPWLIAAARNGLGMYGKTLKLSIFWLCTNTPFRVRNDNFSSFIVHWCNKKGKIRGCKNKNYENAIIPVFFNRTKKC